MSHKQLPMSSSMADRKFREIENWLAALSKEKGVNLTQYAEKFKEANITTELVALMEDRHFKDIGISTIGHRIILSQNAKKFKREVAAYDRGAAIKVFKEWYWRPMCYVRHYKLTSTALIVSIPHPFQCSHTIEQIDLTTVVDLALHEWCFLGYVEVKSTDPVLPGVRMRLRLKEARDIFETLKDLWEEGKEVSLL